MSERQDYVQHPESDQAGVYRTVPRYLAENRNKLGISRDSCDIGMNNQHGLSQDVVQVVTSCVTLIQLTELIKNSLEHSKVHSTRLIELIDIALAQIERQTSSMYSEVIFIVESDE